MSRLLWSGSAKTGDVIDVPNISDYSLCSVNMSVGTSILARTFGNSFYGIGGSVPSNNNTEIYVFGAIINTNSDNLDIRDCRQYSINGNTWPTSYSSMTITSITGLI